MNKQEMKTNYKMYSRIAGVLTLGVFAASAYIGAYDKVLQSVPSHWYLDWAISIASLVAAGLLISMPTRLWAVVLGGVVWPIVYVGGLGFDVLTKLCAGASQEYCWPSRNAAFQYLILNNPNAQGQGWTLFPFTIPLAIVLILISLVLSILAVISIRRSRITSGKSVTEYSTDSASKRSTQASTIRSNSLETNSKILATRFDISPTYHAVQ